jgi:hypothetical protein
MMRANLPSKLSSGPRQREGEGRALPLHDGAGYRRYSCHSEHMKRYLARRGAREQSMQQRNKT